MKVYQVIRYSEEGHATFTNLFSTAAKAFDARDREREEEYFKGATWEVIERELDSFDHDNFKPFLERPRR